MCCQWPRLAEVTSLERTVVSLEIRGAAVVIGVEGQCAFTKGKAFCRG
jgi:hypothetical protein